jgi:squalene cyclase
VLQKIQRYGGPMLQNLTGLVMENQADIGLLIERDSPALGAWRRWMKVGQFRRIAARPSVAEYSHG